MSNETKKDEVRPEELDELTAEEKRLDLELKRRELARRQREDAALQVKENQAKADLEMKNRTVAQQMLQRKANQDACNHKKGGIGPKAVIQGRGTSESYAVIKHQMPNGKFMVLCQRCGKEWHAADPVSGAPETEGYKEALLFPTDNSASGSTYFEFTDNKTGRLLNPRQRNVE